MIKKLPPQELLRKLLRYDPETGKLFWKRRDATDVSTKDPRGAEWVAATFNALWAGKEAFTHKGTSGHLVGTFKGKVFQSHRLIWKMVHGADPDQIDHVNGDRGDNRLFNLRECTSAENGRNRRINKNNTSGHIGVCWAKRQKKWHVQITYERRNRHIGYFKCKDEAVEAYRQAADQYGFHQNHGSKL